MTADLNPPPDCNLCPRLYDFRQANKAAFPDWFNAPVPTFGDTAPALLIVGLAPGLRGANRTGRPFTGDYAGDLLFPTLLKFGFARGVYLASPDDGLTLTGARIANSVSCVPPQNKPTPLETNTCRRFLTRQIEQLPTVRAILSLGGLSHGSVLTMLGLKPSKFKFAHAARHDIGNGRALFDSYHCSRYNTNTGRLTTEMFEQVFIDIRTFLAG